MLLTAKQAAVRLGISLRKLGDLCAKKQISAVKKLGWDTRYDPAYLDNYVQANKTSGPTLAVPRAGNLKTQTKKHW